MDAGGNSHGQSFHGNLGALCYRMRKEKLVNDGWNNRPGDGRAESGAALLMTEKSLVVMPDHLERRIDMRQISRR